MTKRKTKKQKKYASKKKYVQRKKCKKTRKMFKQILLGGTIQDNHRLVQSLVEKGSLHSGSRIYHAMLYIDRGNYCDIPNKDCYSDHPMSIGYQQTISAPHIHALVLHHLQDKLYPGSNVLDVGSGSGYLTALFGYLLKTHKKDNHSKVIGIDLLFPLVKKAIKNIRKQDQKLLQYNKLKIVVGNGWQGYPGMMFDCIHVGAAAKKLPIQLWNQLLPGGKLIIPIQIQTKTIHGKTTFTQVLRLYTKPIKKWKKKCNPPPFHCFYQNIVPVRFVPLQKQSL